MQQIFQRNMQRFRECKQFNICHKTLSGFNALDGVQSVDLQNIR